MSLCSVIIIHSAWKHPCIIALLLPQIRELSEPQLSLMLISLAGDEDYLGPSPWEVSQGSQGEACPVYPERPLLLPLGMITVPSAWSLSSLTTWRDRCPTGKEDSGQFHHLLVFSALRASIRSAFQQLWLLSEEWGKHLRNCNKNDLRIWKEAWQALLTRLATKVTSVK